MATKGRKGARVDEFRGLVTDVHPRRLPSSAFSKDEGSERESAVSWKPRRGMARTNLPRTTSGGKVRSLAYFDTLQGTRSVLAHVGTVHYNGFSDLDSGDGSGATLTASSGDVSAGTYAHMAVAKGRCYSADGRRGMKRWDGGVTTVPRSAGIAMTIADWNPTPAAVSGNPTAGAHLFRYRYKDSKTGYVSNPSNEVLITIASGAEKQTFAVAGSGNTNIVRSGDAKVDVIVLEMTLKDGTLAWFVAAEILNTGVSTAVANSSDAVLGDTPILYPSGRLANGVAPRKRWVIAHKARLWAFGEEVYSTGTIAVTNGSASVTGTGTDWQSNRSGGLLLVGTDTTPVRILTVDSTTGITLAEVYPGSTNGSATYKTYSQDNTVFCSEAGWPESWHLYNFFRGPEEGGPITAAASTPSALVLFNETHMEAYTYGGHPIQSARKDSISSERGALNQRVVVVVDGVVYAMDRRGWHRYAGPGASPDPTSSPIDDILTEIDFTKHEQFHCVYYPRLNAVRWYVILSGDSEPKDYVQYDIALDSWSRGDRERGITASVLASVDAGQRVLLGDENGYTWLDDIGTADGLAPATATTHAVSTSSPSATVVTDADATFPIAGTGLDGVLVFWVEGNETKVILSNTATTFTTGAWASTPPVGSTFHLGRVLSKLKTKAFHVRRDARMELLEAVFTFDPLSSARLLRLRMYFDGSATAFSDYANPEGREPEDGYSPPAVGKNYFTIDLQATGGIVRVGLGIEDAWTVELELESVEPDARFALLSVDFVGLEAEQL